ncbi:hypothetical protein ACIPJ2_11215 [Curtobacterium sp. NPDC090217]|uniref:hypothetical protein n=1 Tax=Curtobacterium sp. NPDC090217 TaxID=3363970 RepID=UPI003803FA1C
MGAPAVRWSVLAVAAVAGAAASLPGPPGQRTTSLAAAVILGAIASVVRSRSANRERPAPIEVRFPMDEVVVDLVPDGRALDSGALHVGRVIGGGPVSIDRLDGVLVVGRGALAAGVFAAVTAGLGATATADQELRVAHGADVVLPELACAPVATLPSGFAVAVLVGADGSRDGSVVLVPDLRCRPRRPCPTIEVTRYGCTLRSDPDEPVGMALAPVLPGLDPPAV